MTTNDAAALQDIREELAELLATVALQQRRIEALEARTVPGLVELRDILNDAKLDELGRPLGTMVSVDDAGRAWHNHPKTIERWCRDGRVPGATKRGRKWFVPLDATVESKASPSFPLHRERAASVKSKADTANPGAVGAMRARTRTLPAKKRAR